MDKNAHRFLSGSFETQAYLITYINKHVEYYDHNYNKMKSRNDKNIMNIISEKLLQCLISHTKKNG